MQNYDVVIIGGGAAGMACAACLSKRADVKVALIEAGDRLGKKLAMTGNGQGNVSNVNLSPDNYHGSVAALAEVVACSDKTIYEKLFSCVFISDERGRVYPSGRQASALTDSFNHTLKRGGIKIFLSISAVGISEKNGKISITLSDGESLLSGFAVICTGGIAQPVMKSLSPYLLAESTGHKITKVYPSLVQLKTDTSYIKTLKGLRADCAVSAVAGGKSAGSRGDVIFTEYGVSGNAIFSVSQLFADRQGEIYIEFLPDIPAEIIIKDIENKKNLGYENSELLSGTLHNQIGRTIIRRAGSSDSGEIVKILKNFKLGVTGTLGFAYAQVTRGGVDAGSIYGNLESKKIKNLFFAGEVLDVDGDCGGYNLQWAFSSGAYVADEILKRI